MEIRRATPDDADAVATISVTGWQAAYRELVPDWYLDSLDIDARAERWRSWIANSDLPRTGTLVADVAGETIGFVSFCPCRDQESALRTGELTAIYVAPARWRCGAGQALAAGAIEHLRTAEFDEAVLWVLEGNDPSRRFYEATGWHPDGGTKVEQMDGFVLAEVRYRRTL